MAEQYGGLQPPLLFIGAKIVKIEIKLSKKNKNIERKKRTFDKENLEIYNKQTNLHLLSKENGGTILTAKRYLRR